MTRVWWSLAPATRAAKIHGRAAFRGRAVRCATAVCVGIVLGACAPAHLRHGVPAESRVLPRQPGPAPATESALRSSLAADTLAARRVLDRCAGRKLLPEQESTTEATQRLLRDAGSALAQGDLALAASLARQARQLSRSIGCP